jgi:hypothetical protein
VISATPRPVAPSSFQAVSWAKERLWLSYVDVMVLSRDYFLPDRRLGVMTTHTPTARRVTRSAAVEDRGDLVERLLPEPPG